jgi:hypothetical protein
MTRSGEASASEKTPEPLLSGGSSADIACVCSPVFGGTAFPVDMLTPLRKRRRV